MMMMMMMMMMMVMMMMMMMMMMGLTERLKLLQLRPLLVRAQPSRRTHSV